MATSPTLRTRADEPTLPITDERLLLVERIVATEAFQKSSRLPALLRYLATCTLAGDRAGLTEHTIGHVVFEKPRDFNPTEDSSVRVYMRQLRLRLHEFYQSAGQSEPIVIDVPKGGYALAFHPRHAAAFPPIGEPHHAEAPAASPVLASAAEPAHAHRTAWLPWVLLAVALVTAAAGWYRWSVAAAANSVPWPLAGVVQPGQQTTVVLADGSFMLRLLGDQPVKLDAYADQHYADNLIPPNASEGELRLFRYLQSAQMTSMADAHAVSTITALAGAARDGLIIRSAKEVNGDMLTHGNFIFVGARNSNPWVQLYEDRLNFRIAEDTQRKLRYLVNRAPRPGEQAEYSIPNPTGYSGDDYAIISVVPGTNGQGSVMLIQGIRREGTDAAIHFLASREDRSLAEQKLKAANHGTLPRYFEILLHAYSVAGSAASIECVAVRATS